MTTEDDFRMAITAAPEDRTLLAVYADYLRENGQEALADGWAAIATQQRRPKMWDDTRYSWIRAREWRGYGMCSFRDSLYSWVDDDWFDRMPPFVRTSDSSIERKTVFDSFRDLAVAFTLLPAERRSELLCAAVEVPTMKFSVTE